ncbi:MAG: AhpC/TSA family protein, partial [Deltaproteobacteria bacterium]
PDFTLPDVNGKPVHLTDCLRDGAVVLSFYRGGWCPYCNLELQALADAWPDIRGLGATLLAIAPEKPDHGRETAARHALPFPVLWDEANRVARAYGLVFSLPESLRPVYAALGIDLPAWNGENSFELPMPATFVVGEDGRILDGFVSVDYTRRMEPARVIEVLKNRRK